MDTIAAAKSGDAEEARKKLQDAAEELSKAHHYQTELIQNEAGGEKTEMTLLMVHAQDHLMNAMTVKDMAAEIIELYEKSPSKGEQAYDKRIEDCNDWRRFKLYA